MKYLQLLLGYLLCLAFFATAGCKPKPKNQIVGEPPAGQPTSPPVVSSPVQSPSLSPSSTQASQIKAGQSPSRALSRLENSVRPSVIWVTVFDSSGKLLRTQTGFFISADGRLVTTAHAIEGGINAVAKTADGGIYNVSGILASSTALDLAILQADVKQKPFLVLNKNVNLPIGTPVGVVGSGLAGSEGIPREATISTQQSDRFEIGAAISPNAIGSPIVDANAEVVGVAVSAGEKATVRSSNSLESLLSQIASNATPRWPQTAQTSPSPSPSPRPTPTPKPRLVYAPAPSFPPDATRPGASGSGRFRLTFDARGNVRNVEIVQSTGNALFDQASTKTLRQWKCTPGREWVATVPVTFQSR
jgi:TonB family protein